jgi:drug/metabolite transporter (DMT)-like permease
MLAMAFTNVLFSCATKLTTAGNAIVLQFTAPIFIMIIEAAAYGKKPGKFDLTVCSIVFAGIILFFIDGLSSGNMLGNALAVCSGFTYAFVMMMNEMKDGDSWSSTFLGHSLGALIGLPFFLTTDFSTSTASTWAAALALGAVQMGTAYILLNYGLQTTPPITAILITGIEPVLNPIWVALFYHEMLTPLSMAGAVIVLITVMYYNYRKVRI